MSIETIPQTAEQLFHPVEHHILSKFFDVAPPDYARLVSVEKLLNTYSQDFISLKPDGSSESTSNANAVARLLLYSVQASLPQWASIHISSGEINFARHLEEPIENRISLLPQYAFGINWADTAPGLSCPEQYYVTFVPYYERYVVTRSRESPDAYGYCDLPIDHFDMDTPLLEGLKTVICADWQEQRGNDQSRWGESWSGSLISFDESDRWADEVWYGPTRILMNLLEDNEDQCGTRYDMLSEQEQKAIKESVEYLPD